MNNYIKRICIHTTFWSALFSQWVMYISLKTCFRCCFWSLQRHSGMAWERIIRGRRAQAVFWSQDKPWIDSVWMHKWESASNMDWRDLKITFNETITSFDTTAEFDTRLSFVLVQSKEGVFGDVNQLSLSMVGFILKNISFLLWRFQNLRKPQVGKGLQRFSECIVDIWESTCLISCGSIDP